MLTAFTIAVLSQVPPPPAGAVVRLGDWAGKPAVVVRVESVSPAPVAWTDGNGRRRNEVAVTYVDPEGGRMIESLATFVAHVRPMFAPVGPPVPVHDLPLASTAPPPEPPSNQSISDGVRRPSDILRSPPAIDRDYYSAFRARAGAVR